MATRINSVRKVFTAEGGKIDNFSLMSKMLDVVEAVRGGSSTEPGSRVFYYLLFLISYFLFSNSPLAPKPLHSTDREGLFSSKWPTSLTSNLQFYP